MKIENTKSIILTFDVEDWFQVENFKEYIPFSSWSSFYLRVENNTHKILDLLDSFSFAPKATFFVLGWIAERMPQLVREIQKRGHEVASHGVNHHLPPNQSLKDFSDDLKISKKLLEDITGEKIYGYRAPSFAVNDDLLNTIRDAGYLYDSSYNSFAMHGRYGQLDIAEKVTPGAGFKVLDDFYEFPVSNHKIKELVIPLGGGGYFRLIPFPFFKQGIKSVLKREDSFLFYSHPWEFDPEQPRVKQASLSFKFRHYFNLHRTETKLSSMVESFRDVKFHSCIGYLADEFIA